MALALGVGLVGLGGCYGSGDPANPPVGSISIPKDVKEGSSVEKAKDKKARAGN